MKPEHSQYILKHIKTRSIDEIAEDLNIKPRKINKFLLQQKTPKEAEVRQPDKSPLDLRQFLPLSAIFLLSLFLNILGNSWGTPANWHPDNKIHHIASFLQTGDLNPHFFTNPSLNLYLQYFFIKLMLFFKGSGALDSSFLIIHCRTFTGILSALTVLVIFLISRQLLNSRSGSFSAFLFACTAGNVFYSHFSTPEALATLLSMTTLLFIVKFLDSGKNIFLYLAALFLGLALSTKYTVFSLFAFLVLSVFLVQRDRQKGRLDGAASTARNISPIVIQGVSILCGIMCLAFVFSVFNDTFPDSVKNYLLKASFKSNYNKILPEYIPLGVLKLKNLLLLIGFTALIVFPLIQFFKKIAEPINRLLSSRELFISFFIMVTAFLMGTPYAVLDHNQFFHDVFVSWQSQYYYNGVVFSGTSFIPNIKSMIGLLGWPLFIAGLCGMAWALITTSIKDKKKICLLAGYFVIMYLFLATRSNAAPRFAFPIIPVIPIFAGLLFAQAHKAKPAAVKYFSIILTVFTLGYSFLYALSVDKILMNDPRISANRWIEENIPEDAVIGVFTHQRYLPNFNQGRKIYRVSEMVNFDADFKAFTDTFPQLPADYLVLSEQSYSWFMKSKEYSQRGDFYRSLINGEMNYRIAARFKYHGLLNPPLDFSNSEILILKNNNSRL